MSTHVKIHTDHSCLPGLLEISKPSRTLLRWRLRLSEFDFNVLYKKGAFNTQSDALSRQGTTAEVEPAQDLDIPCLMVADLHDGAEILTGELCDDILVSKPSEAPALFCTDYSREDDT